MTPACAICIQPIIAGQKFLIAGTEVVHRVCATTGHKTRMQVVELELRRAREDLEHARSRLATVEARRQREADGHALREAQARRDATKERDEHRQQVRGLEAALEDARLALALSATRPPTTTHSASEMRPEVSTSAPNDAHDTRDGTEVRFSLLEFE